MDLKSIEAKLSSLTGDAKQGAIDAIKAILGQRQPMPQNPNGSGKGGKGGMGNQIDIDPDLLVPTSKRNQERNTSNRDFDDPEGLLKKLKQHGKKDNKEIEPGPYGNPKKPDNPQKSDNPSGPHGPLGPQIGDRGDVNGPIQTAEDIYRKAHEYKNDAEKKAEKAANKGDENAADRQQDLADKAKELADDAKNLANDAANNDDSAEVQRRIKEIADAFRDLKQQRNLIDETEQKVFKDRRERRSKEQQRREHQHVSSGDLNAFKHSIEKFMRDTLGDAREYTWRRFNKNLVGTGLLGKGRGTSHNQKIPKLAVYFDQSASWGQDDVERGFRAISTLNEYVKRGQLKIEVYYFAVDIHDTPEPARREGGTCRADKLLEDIAAKKPNNVVIMTDGDVDSMDNTKYVTVDGGVWLLFKNALYMSKDLPEHLRGKKLNKIFTL